MHLSQPTAFGDIAELNPPPLPTMDHVRLEGRWHEALVTDNPFRQIRISPYAYAARLAHDAPSVRPTVVCSTRDRNMLAIESEVRGAIGNGVRSFLVVRGDTVPQVEHWSDAHEIVEFLADLRRRTAPFEIGMALASRAQLERRARSGAQFFIFGPVIDPSSVEALAERLALRAGDPPVYLSLVPPFSQSWVRRITGLGAEPIGEALLDALGDEDWSRRRAWGAAREARQRAADCGFAGTVLMGCRFETLAEEAFWEWRRADSPLDERRAGWMAPVDPELRDAARPVLPLATRGLEGGT
jgi:5,10-methylenetetrahydrofolate reductase